MTSRNLKISIHTLLFFTVTFISLRGTGNPLPVVELTNLRCEYLKNPYGIDNLKPRFSWELVSLQRGKMQQYYRIMVSKDSVTLEGDTGEMWDSGKVRSGAANQVAYGGKPLSSGEIYYWKVKIWDEHNNESGWSAIKHWSMGLLDKKDWKAKWIGQEPVLEATAQDMHIIPPSPLLRKEFKVAKKIKKAFLYATALGVYEVYLNGSKVGDYVLAPEWTDYFTRVQYQTYDVTDILLSDRNVIGASLADGWYAGVLFTHGKPQRGNYGFNRRLLAQLHITYVDGTTDTVVTDESWKILKDGPIKEASIFDGEVFDARYQPRHWLKPGFDDSCWEPVTTDPSVSITLNAQMNEPIKIVEEVKPIHVFEVAKGTCIFDMGQNMAGWVKLAIPYNPGRKLVFRYGEMLDEDSTLYVKNLRTAKQTDVYIPGTEKQVEYEPRFTYHGFRYVEISGLDHVPALNELTGKVVASSSSIVSRFETSNKDVNKLWENILWTQLGNMHSIPEDCPQRDERCGWMGDAQVFSQTAIYNMDMAAFYTKWFRDIRDMQTEEGRFPNYAPQVGMTFYDAPGWADAGVIIPWKAYVNYGDKRILESQYDAMKKFIDYVHSQNSDHIRVNAVGQNYGDWLNGNTIRVDGYPKAKGSVPKDLYSTAFFAYSTRLLANASKVLGKSREYKYYHTLYHEIRNTFIREFIDANGVVKGDTQAGYALALEFDLVPDTLKEKVVQHMVNAVKEYDFRISTGIQTTIRLMNQLSANGYAGVAYKLLESHRFPSWLYSIDQGATTIWERWDGYVKGRGFQGPGMNSFNHYAIGAVGEWMYKHILGINYDELNPGYRHFIIKPKPGGSLTWAKGSYHSIMGNIVVNWQDNSTTFSCEITIPANTSATLVLPVEGQITESGIPANKAKGVRLTGKNKGTTSFALQSGKYSFKVVK
ncbi:family 78 glycoside hydrolase catalytic domain [Agriterribacter sp.]|uniref:alpha-L-rhamnosidase n=1 Tax=Agriterribacter sp. TaxID=2821509 RepID=UPI002C0284CF|nr:family 78 glycoside hydrolase catalytic domain [Agriterribacter sp.]HRP56286.1 family 78 glycoside hydrolase catalytic domain [Agriterribacter sp.]